LIAGKNRNENFPSKIIDALHRLGPSLRRAEFAPPLAKPHTTNPGAYLQTTSALSTLKYSGNKEKSQLDIGKWIVSTTMG
jgi:hypothetical protein